MKDLKIESIRIGEIFPYINNPRFNNDAVDAVAASIKEFGFKVPIIIDKDNIVVTGHTRLKAAHKLGMDKVPCIRADDLTDDDFRIYGDERERTNNAYNLHLIDWDNLTNDFWQMPIIENDGFIPDELIGFNYAKSNKDKNVGIHFYLDDYQFERIWNYPEKYYDVLMEYDCILSPNFSLYMDMPMAMKIWNTYR